MWTYILAAFQGPGAPFLYLITAVGAFALAIVVERVFWLHLRWRPSASAVLRAIDAGDVELARRAAGDTPLGDVVKAGLSEGSVEAAWEAMSAASVEAEESVRARIGYLATIGNLSTMLGLLGTVYGLMIAFGSLGDTSGGARTVRLSEGISAAMAVTALGLVVGIFSLAAHAALDVRARQLLAMLEVCAGRIALRARKS